MEVRERLDKEKLGPVFLVLISHDIDYQPLNYYDLTKVRYMVDGYDECRKVNFSQQSWTDLITYFAIRANSKRYNANYVITKKDQLYEKKIVFDLNLSGMKSSDEINRAISEHTYQEEKGEYFITLPAEIKGEIDGYSLLMDLVGFSMKKEKFITTIRNSAMLSSLMVIHESKGLELKLQFSSELKNEIEFVYSKYLSQSIFLPYTQIGV
jgi:hypothetical protein